MEKNAIIYDKPLLIASSYTIGNFILLFISIFLVCGLAGMTIYNLDTFVFKKFAILLVFWVVVLLFFFLVLQGFQRVVVDCKNKTINIQRLPLKIFYKQISFNEIKTIQFIGEKIIDDEVTFDFKGYWRESIKIIGLQNNELYDDSFPEVINYEILEKLCSEYFNIDYITIDKTDL
jgi:hypothetical protein